MLLHVMVYLTPSSDLVCSLLKNTCFCAIIICSTVVVSLKAQLCWFTTMMQNGMLQNNKCIPSIFKDESTGSCNMSLEACCCSSNLRFSCQITKTQTHNTERLLLTTMPNTSQLDNNTNCISMATLKTLCVHCRQATSTTTTINKVYCFPAPPTTLA
jgi:hypothetical protein